MTSLIRCGYINLVFVLFTVRKPDYLIDDDAWLLANINFTGYYRVNYDEENWNRLLNQLNTNHHVSMFHTTLATRGKVSCSKVHVESSVVL